MCLIILGINVRVDYPLVILANRDEFYDRPAMQVHQWKEGGIVAGKDLTGKGTWLGVNNSGKVAAITNYRDLKNLKENAPTRGMLTLDYLKNDMSPVEYIEKISINSKDYNGYNLILGKGDKFFHFSNVNNKTAPLGNGIYGLSNALLDTPWPKVIESKRHFQLAMNRDKINDEELINILLDKAQARVEELPDTGIPLELEKKLSSRFINFKGYGTRCTSLIKKDRNGKIFFREIVYNEGGQLMESVDINV